MLSSTADGGSAIDVRLEKRPMQFKASQMSGDGGFALEGRGGGLEKGVGGGAMVGNWARRGSGGCVGKWGSGRGVKNTYVGGVLCAASMKLRCGGRGISAGEKEAGHGGSG